MDRMFFWSTSTTGSSPPTEGLKVLDVVPAEEGKWLQRGVESSQDRNLN